MFLPTNITLKFGDSGDFVSELQRRLSLIKCFNADAINGFYDGVTTNAVSQFQSQSGITADGVAGPETLRRLNGAISGDFGSSSEQKAAEEEKLRQEQLQQQQLLQQQALLEEQRAREAQEAAAALAAQQQAQLAAAAPPAPPPAAPLTAEAYVPQGFGAPQASMAAPPSVAVPPPPPPAPPPITVAPVALAAATPQAPAAAPLTAGDMLSQMLQNHQQTMQTIEKQAAAKPAEMKADPQAVAASPAEPARGGLLTRAMQFASDTMQKIASYIESKLPPSVLKEVQDIGVTMARSGVREAPLPTGPAQQQQRGVEGPARGQQQGNQIG
jgi:hypothetical protein